MERAAAVVNEFFKLQYSEEGRDCPQIDRLKIQALLYYAQAWNLAIKGEPLFKETVHASMSGPLVKDIYNQFIDCNNGAIIGRRATLSRAINVAGKNDIEIIEPYIFDKDTAGFIKMVFENHKTFTGAQLINSTHSPGEPWDFMRTTCGDLSGTPAIPHELMREIFVQKLQPSMNSMRYAPVVPK